MKKRRRLKRRFRILVGLIFFMAIFSRLFSRTDNNRIAPTPTPDPIYPHDYDWTHLETASDFYAYADARHTSKIGVDVSYIQKEIDWQAVKDAGVQFAMIRVGYRGYAEGLLHEDEYYRANMNGARAAGLPTGVYWVSHAVDEEEVLAEADYVLLLIRDYDLALPIAYDMEYSHDEDRIRSLSRKEKTRLAALFIQRIKDAGYVPLVYGSASWLRDEINMVSLQDETDFWLANYGVRHPAFPYRFTMWQYTENGHVDGITTDVDLNLLLEPAASVHKGT